MQELLDLGLEPERFPSLTCRWGRWCLAGFPFWWPMFERNSTLAFQAANAFSLQCMPKVVEELGNIWDLLASSKRCMESRSAVCFVIFSL